MTKEEVAGLAARLRKLAKPVKVLAGVGVRGVVYRTDKPPHAKEMADAATALEAMQAELDRVRADQDRLDFLDSLNERLNQHYGTNYRWELIINHNVNRLMLNFPRGVDLNDSTAHGFKSCRDVIDREMARISASRRARTEASTITRKEPAHD